MSYITILCNFIESDYILVGKTLTEDFPAEDTKTGKNIRRELVQLLVNKCGLNPIVKALEPYRRILCLDHVINTVLRHGLDMDALSKNAPDNGEIISAAKGLVRYIKQMDWQHNYQKLCFKWVR